MIPINQDHEAETLAWYAQTVERLKAACTKCDGMGWAELDTNPHECDCLKRAKALLCYRRGNIPKQFQAEPSFEIKNKAVLDFAKRCNGQLALTGSNGTGKTTLAAYVLRRAAEAGMSIFRIEATEAERAWALAKTGHAMRWLDLWMQNGLFCDVVSIDELGQGLEKTFHWEETRNTLAYYIKHRYEQEMPTIVCTNLKQDEFTRIYGETAASIVFGNGYTRVGLIGGDRRQGK